MAEILAGDEQEQPDAGDKGRAVGPIRLSASAREFEVRLSCDGGACDYCRCRCEVSVTSSYL